MGVLGAYLSTVEVISHLSTVLSILLLATGVQTKIKLILAVPENRPPLGSRERGGWGSRSLYKFTILSLHILGQQW